jgi:hypothetical protein
MLWFINFYLSYQDYFSFLLWAIVLSLFYYFFISTFLEMNMDLLKKNVTGKHAILSSLFSAINTVLFIYIIYNFAQIYISRGANHLGVLFLLVAWSFLVVRLNKRFNIQPWFSFVLFCSSWLSILLLWFQS